MNMKKLLAVALAAVLSLTMFAGCGSGGQSSKELVIYTWSGFVPDDVIKSFEEETGIKIIYNSFETDEEMLAKLSTAKGGDYDIVIADDYIIKMAADQGLVKTLDKSKIPNYSNIDPIYQGFFYDPDNTLTVPYGPGIPLLVYNPEQVSTEITGYESLWDPSLKDSIALMDSPRVVTGMALKTMGESFNTEDTDKIRQAGEKLLELAPNIRILSMDQTQEYLLSGEVSVAYLLSLIHI